MLSFFRSSFILTQQKYVAGSCNTEYRSRDWTSWSCFLWSLGGIEKQTANEETTCRNFLQLPRHKLNISFLWKFCKIWFLNHVCTTQNVSPLLWLKSSLIRKVLESFDWLRLTKQCILNIKLSKKIGEVYDMQIKLDFPPYFYLD